MAKHVAMQVASMTPTYVSRNDMPQDVVEHERYIQQELVKNDESLANKPDKVKEGIVEGRVSKALKEMCLVDQEYFLESDKTVGAYLKEQGAEVVKFVRFKVGNLLRKCNAQKEKGVPVLQIFKYKLCNVFADRSMYMQQKTGASREEFSKNTFTASGNVIPGLPNNASFALVRQKRVCPDATDALCRGCPYYGAHP